CGRARPPARCGSARPRPRASSVHRLEEVGEHLRRSEEHTSELQSRENLVCRLLLEKKKTDIDRRTRTWRCSLRSTIRRPHNEIAPAFVGHFYLHNHTDRLTHSSRSSAHALLVIDTR